MCGEEEQIIYDGFRRGSVRLWSDPVKESLEREERGKGREAAAGRLPKQPLAPISLF